MVTERPASAAVRAAVRPATPEPRTRTSTPRPFMADRRPWPSPSGRRMKGRGSSPAGPRGSGGAPRNDSAHGHHGVGHGPVAVVDVDDRGGEALEFGGLVVGVGDDDHPVAGVHEAGGGSVEGHLARPAHDGVGLEPGAVVDVEDGDLLPLQDVGQRHELGVEGDRADVVEVGPGHLRPVDLRLHHRAAHRPSPVGATVTPASTTAPRASTRMVMLSIRRTSPTRAATATSTSPSSTSSGANVSAATTSAYSSRTSSSVVRTLATTRRSRAASRSPPPTTSSAPVWSPRWITVAASRWAGDRLRLRLDMASPSGSRTSGQPTISTGRHRPAGMSPAPARALGAFLS